MRNKLTTRETPPNKNRAAQEKLINKMRSRRRKYEIAINGKDFIVHPNVFSPLYVLDSQFFASNFPDQKGKDFLEIGTGTGLIAIIAALQGARSVTAVDINVRAVRNTIENANRHSVRNIITAYRSNIFQSVPRNQRFDSIFWNVPWANLGAGLRLSMMQRAFYDPQYRQLRRFILGAPSFLRQDGRLFVGYSTSIGNHRILERLFVKAHFNARIIAEQVFGRGHPAGTISVELFEAQLGGAQ